MLALTLKVLIGTAATLVAAWALRHPGLFMRRSDSGFIAAILGLQLIPALALFAILYVVGHQEITSDVPGYYVPAGRAVLAGQVPFLDFTLSYAPLFPYVAAALLSAWNSGKVFAIFAIVLNSCALLLWNAAATALFDRRTARETSVLYAASGQVLVQELLGTNQVWIAAALAGSALLLVRGRSAGSGLIQGLALSVVKFLVVLFWPVMWIFAPRRLNWLGGALLISTAIYATFAICGADVLYPLRFEGEHFSSGNLPYLLQPLLARDSRFAYRILDGLAALSFTAITAWLYFMARQVPVATRLPLLLPGLALAQLVFMLLSKKSFTGYALFCMYPMMLVLVLGVTAYLWRVALFFVLNVVAVIEPSLWFYLGGNDRPLDQWLRESHAVGIQLFLAVDLAIVGCYAYLAWVAVSWLASQRSLQQTTSDGTTGR
jgi:hypothetical protein